MERITLKVYAFLLKRKLRQYSYSDRQINAIFEFYGLTKMQKVRKNQSKSWLTEK